MRKIIPFILVLLLLSGCETRSYTPVINEDFKLSAIYTAGDFSFSCDIERKGGTVTLTPTSTRAKGTVISCNGKEVTFRRKGFVKTFDISEIDKTNPAVLLSGIFSDLPNAEVKLIDGVFTYTGKCMLGNYILRQNTDNTFKSLTLPQAGVEVVFKL